MALFVILGCTDGFAEEVRDRLLQIPLVRSVASVARERFGGAEPSLVETRLYRKVPRRRQSEQVLAPEGGQLGFTTPESEWDLDETTTPTPTPKPTPPRRERTRPAPRTRYEICTLAPP